MLKAFIATAALGAALTAQANPGVSIRFAKAAGDGVTFVIEENGNLVASAPCHYESDADVAFNGPVTERLTCSTRGVWADYQASGEFWYGSFSAVLASGETIKGENYTCHKDVRDQANFLECYYVPSAELPSLPF